MTTTRHAPAPWYVARASGGQGLVISEQTGANIAVTYDEKDAPIVAAAPEMLAALRDVDTQLFAILDEERFSLDYRKSVRATFNLVLAAISKAEGRT